LLFALPILLITAVIVYGYVTSIQPGTLVISARDANSLKDLSVEVVVNGGLISAPSTLSLPQGIYTVTFTDIQWYKTPGPRTVSLSAGRTAYALGEYKRAPVVVQITTNGFDATSLAAKGGITPVIWVNRSGATVLLDGDLFNRAFVPPGQNFTYTYTTAGRYAFWLDSTDVRGTVSVA
jgi:plastocyanin